MQLNSAKFGAIDRALSRFFIVLSAAFLISTAVLAQQAGAARNAADAEQTYSAFQVKSTGHGPAIIMIPGLASSGSTWDATAAHLGDRYRCIQLTLAGFTGAAPIASPLLTTARDQIAQYIRDNHLERPVIMGHSLGGTIALDLAAQYPKLVGPVVIVDSLPFMAGAWFRVDTLAAAQPAIDQMKAYMQGMTPEQWQATTRTGASTNSMATSEKDQKTLIEWGLASDQKTVTNAMIDLVGVDLRPELGKIETPVLVIGTWIGLKNYGATEEAVTGVFKQQYVGVKHLRFVMAQQARHFVMWDDPSWFNTQVDAFLADGNQLSAAGR
jgi:pimeloyl-ACP methyl ester carboxylesterase